MLRSKHVAATGFMIASCVLVGVVLPAGESKSTGSCKAEGYDGCCDNSCYGNVTDCYCDHRCFTYGDCCSDIHEIGCLEDTEGASSVVSTSSTMDHHSTSVIFPASSPVVPTYTTSMMGPDTTLALFYASSPVVPTYATSTKGPDIDTTSALVHASSPVVPTYTTSTKGPDIDTPSALVHVLLAACAIAVLLIAVAMLIVCIVVCIIKKRRQQGQAPMFSPSHIYHTITHKGKLATKSFSKEEGENIYDDIKGVSGRKIAELTANVSYTHITANTAYGNASNSVPNIYDTANPTYKPSTVANPTYKPSTVANPTYTPSSVANPMYKQVPNSAAYTYVTDNKGYEYIGDNNAYADVNDYNAYAHVADNVDYANDAGNFAN